MKCLECVRTTFLIRPTVANKKLAPTNLLINMGERGALGISRRARRSSSCFPPAPRRKLQDKYTPPSVFEYTLTPMYVQTPALYLGFRERRYYACELHCHPLLHFPAYLWPADFLLPRYVSWTWRQNFKLPLELKDLWSFWQFYSGNLRVVLIFHPSQLILYLVQSKLNNQLQNSSFASKVCAPMIKN